MPKKRLVGEVVRHKMEKTVAVRVERKKRHPRYQKLVKSSRLYLAHRDIEVKVGDHVVIEECRPLSANKRFKIVEVLER